MRGGGLMLRWLDLLYAVPMSGWLACRWVRGRAAGRLALSRALGQVWGARLDAARPVWMHGVSVGEVLALVPLVARFRARFPGVPVVISASTTTGLTTAHDRFPDLPVFAFPLDWSWAVRRSLDTVNPRLIVLAESELWPNFLAEAKRRGVPVVVVNARLSPRSYRRYAMLGRVGRWLLTQVDHFAVQSPVYAEQLSRLGVPPGRLSVTGSIKYDGVCGDRDNPKTSQLRRLFGLRATDPVIVFGSTQAPEEALALRAFTQLQRQCPDLRMLIVPRHPERFEQVALLLAESGLPFVRRSQLRQPLDRCPPLVLVDTVGELAAVWGLACIAFVGGSLDGKRGGQNLIEPAAYGAAVVVGPHTWNFRDVVTRFTQAGALRVVHTGDELTATLSRWLADPIERLRIAETARQLVLSGQGATERTLAILQAFLPETMARQVA